MWIFSESGFVSAVVVSGNLLQVRARDSESLEGLSVSQGVGIISTPGGDYPYRIEISREQFINWVIEQIGFLEYRNFKERVSDTRGFDYVHALHQVWDIMHQVEDKDARNP